MYHCETIDPLALSACDRARWIELIKAGGFASPLFHPDFTLAVRRTRPDARIALLRDDKGLAAVLAHHRRRGGFARPIGSAFSDLHAIPCRPDFDWPLSRVLQAADLSAMRFTGLHLDPARSASAVLSPHLQRQGPDTSLAARPDGDGQAFLEARRRAHPRKFKAFRRLLRKLESEAGPVELVVETDRAALDTLIGWKRQQLRRAGRHDVYAPRWARDLMTGLLAGEGEVRGLLVALKVDGRMIAGEFGPCWNRVFHPWIATYDRAWSKISPGHLLVHQLCAAMPALGLDHYEMGAECEGYKAYFANAAAPIHAGLVRASDPARRRGAAAPFPMNAALRAPALYGTAARVRSRLDHIAAAEPGLPGRMRGVWLAAAGLIARP